jgi:cell division protein FtsB
LRRLHFLLSTLAAAALCGSALYTDQEALQKRVTDLEGQVKKLEADREAAAREDHVQHLLLTAIAVPRKNKTP